jgi:hypothetical protein
VDDGLSHLAENMRVLRRKKGNSKGKASRPRRTKKVRCPCIALGVIYAERGWHGITWGNFRS